MQFISTSIAGVVIIEPTIFTDERGYFFESYNAKTFRENGIECSFVQDNQSQSCYGVIRGLHSQAEPYAQAKLVRVLSGTVLDVAVDVRSGSSTYGQHIAVELSDKNQRQLFIPRGFLHGFSVLSEQCVLSYKCDNFYHKASEFSVRYDDPTLAIDWKIPQNHIIVTSKDKQAGVLREYTYNR